MKTSIPFLRLKHLGLAAGLSLSLSAHAAEPLKTCFVYSNPIGESGWTYQQELARQALAANMGDKITTKYVENVPEGPDAERVIRSFVREGCQVIFTPSFGFMEPTVKVAKQFPKTIFLNGTGFKTAKNLGVYNARYYEGRYLEGVIAGSISKTGEIGYVGAFPIPEVLQGVNAFALGLRSVNPKAIVKIVWLNTWYDPGKERDAAKTLMDLGVDVLAYATSGVAIVAAAEQRGVNTVGYYSDVSKFGPNTNLTSVEVTFGKYYTDVIQDVLDGKWETMNYMGGLKEGMIRMSPLNQSIPEDVRKKFESTQQAIIDGSLNPFQGPIFDQKGKERVPANETMSDQDMANMNYLVQGVEG